MQHVRIATLSLAALLAAAGCGSSRESGPAPATVTVPAGGPAGGAVTLVVDACTPCHGDPGRPTTGADALVQAAPPRAPGGDPADPVIGAHLAHLTDGPLARAVACASCHVVPASPASHGAQVVVFSGRATTGGAAPTWTPATLTCSSTYCHGAFPGGAGANAVQWSGAAPQCGSCHLVPPTATSTGHVHPQYTDCGACHPGYTSSSVATDTHVDGRIDVTLTCTSCHGDPARAGRTDAGTPPQALAPAPPKDSTGATSSAAVGAHLRHLVNPRFSRPVNCEECHFGAIPTSADHADGTVQVAFGPLSKTIFPTDTRAPFEPTWNGASCSTSYCHGNFKNGAGDNPISWATGSAACGTCHGFPPGGTHANIADCSLCHPPFLNGLPDPAFHLNGVVNFNF
jgi:predicted CxxxxCH...CXXCH cytochrome family protein